MAEGVVQLIQATGHGCVDVLQTGEGWVPKEERRGRMPGHLPAPQDTHFGPLPSGREQVCFVLALTGHAIGKQAIGFLN